MQAFHLTTEQLEARDIAADRARLEQRIESFRHVAPLDEPELIINPVRADNPGSPGDVPEIAARELSVERLSSSIATDGGLIVRELFAPDLAATLTAAIDRVLAAADSPREVKATLESTYFNPPSNLVSIMPDRQRELGALRVFNHRVGAAMCVEAPCIAEALLEMYEALGLKQLVAGYLGEAPCLSVKKWVLRRSTLPVEESGWHQDGAFMGRDINTLNLWLPLSRCGGDTGAPGVDVVPRRLYDIVSAQGASFDWSVAESQVRDAFAANRPVAPVFNPGDAFFFDHLYLHRTQFRPDFTRLRYAIETWFFGASSFSKSQVPVAW